MNRPGPLSSDSDRYRFDPNVGTTRLDSSGYRPLSVRHGSPTVQALWERGITYESIGTLGRLERTGTLRKLPVGWWLSDAGWCPTLAVLDHALHKRNLIQRYAR